MPGISREGGWNVKSFYGLEKQNQFTALGDNNFVVPVEKGRTLVFSWPFKPEILKRKISGGEALLFHFSRVRVKLISKHSLLLPSVDVVRVSFLLPFVFLSGQVHLLGFRPLGNSQYIPSLEITPGRLASLL